MNDIQRAQAQQGQQAAQQNQAVKKAFRRKRPSWKHLVVVLVIIALVVGGLFAKKVFLTGGVKKDQYQAVFLTNGQAYFGKLQNTRGDYLRLTDVFSVQVQAKSAEDAAKTEQNAAQSQDGQPTLVKLGTELAGSEDEIFLSRDQVVFWENIKKDSKVTTAIQEYKNK